MEYLASLARGLDPIPIMDVPELVAELRRRALTLPERGPWDTDPIYAGMCAEVHGMNKRRHIQKHCASHLINRGPQKRT